MLVSEITKEKVAHYLKLDVESMSEEEISELEMMINTAKVFISNYTGIDKSDFDNYEDFVIVIYVLTQDMYDNRALEVDKKNVNRVVDSILGMHCTNLL